MNSLYPVGVFLHYILIIVQLWVTSNPRSTVVVLDTGTPATSRETFHADADGYKQNALAIELPSSKAIAGKELSFSCWCIALLYIFIIAQVWLISPPRSRVALLDTGTPSTRREILSEDADGET